MNAKQAFLVLAALTLLSPHAHAISGVLCIKANGKGTVKVRNPSCKATEVQVGTFDTDAAQASFTPQDLSVLVRLPNDFLKLSGGTVESLPFGLGSEAYDTGNFHDETVNSERLVAPVSGKYLVYAAVMWEPNASGWRMAHITVNGGGDPLLFSTMLPVTGGVESGHVLSTHLNLTAGDYVKLNVQQNSGSSLLVYSTYTSFGMVKVP